MFAREYVRELKRKKREEEERKRREEEERRRKEEKEKGEKLMEESFQQAQKELFAMARLAEMRAHEVSTKDSGKDLDKMFTFLAEDKHDTSSNAAIVESVGLWAVRDILDRFGINVPFCHGMFVLYLPPTA